MAIDALIALSHGIWVVASLMSSLGPVQRDRAVMVALDSADCDMFRVACDVAGAPIVRDIANQAHNLLNGNGSVSMYSHAQRSSLHIGVPRRRRVGVLHVEGNTKCV